MFENALRKILGLGGSSQPQHAVAQNAQAPLPASPLQQLLHPTAQSNPSQVNVGGHQFNYASPDVNVGPNNNKQSTVFRGITFGDGQVVGKPIQDEGIYTTSTPDTTVINPNEVMGQTFVGKPIVSATLRTPAQPQQLRRILQ